jgi:hypothetical protein
MVILAAKGEQEPGRRPRRRERRRGRDPVLLSS